MANPEVSKVILDPSVLFTDDGLAWLGDRSLRRYLVISQALWQRLQEPDAVEQLARHGIETTAEEVLRVLNAVEGLERFSWEGKDLRDGARQILDTLRSLDEPLGDVIVDEWAFVTSQSLLAVRDMAVRTVKAFVRAGAKVYEVTDREMERGLRAIRRNLPPRLLTVMKGIGRARLPGELGKFIMMGGGIALLFSTPVTMPAGIVLEVQQGIALIAGDP